MFIVVEGPNGTGKSLQVDLLKCCLQRRGYDVLVTREPGGTEIGKILRNVCLSNKKDKDGNILLDPTAEILCFLADKFQHVREVIYPHLTRGGLVITDRYLISSMVFQYILQGNPIEEYLDLIDSLGGLPIPDLNIVVSLPVGEIKKMIWRRAPHKMEIDKFEEFDENYQLQAVAAYESFASKLDLFPRIGNTTLIKRDDTPDRVHQELMEQLDIMLGDRIRGVQ